MDILWSKDQNTSLISDLTTKMVTKHIAYFEESRALFYGRELDPLTVNWAHERSFHFRYYSGEKNVERLQLSF